MTCTARTAVTVAIAATLSTLALPASAAAPPPLPVLATSGQHTFVVRADGTAWGWSFGVSTGDRSHLGRGPVVQPASAGEPAPAIVTNAKSVATGARHTLVLDTGGTVWSFGWNVKGQLGDGTQTDRSVPSPVPLSGVTAVAAGGTHSLALRSDGTVWAWGDNEYGQLGDGTTTQRLLPVQVAGLAGVVAIEATTYGHGATSVALKSDGTVWTWGGNNTGQLGIGTTVDQHAPVRVTGVSDVTAIGAGWTHTLVVRADGTVWAWGPNSDGQLGTGNTIGSWVPVQVIGLTNAVAVAGGDYHSLALRADGSVWSWGSNWAGQLGDGTTSDRLVAAPSLMQAAVAISAGHDYSVATSASTTVFEWGDNLKSSATSPVPVPKPGIVGAATPA